MELTIKVRKVAYRKLPNEWTILLSTTGEKYTGDIPWEVEPDDIVRVSGKWTKNEYGRQFEFHDISSDIPRDPRALLAYCVDVCKGAGPSLETKIWVRFGSGWWDEDIRKIRGVSAAVVANWAYAKERLEETRKHTDAIAYLRSVGVTPGMAEAAWREWESAAPVVVEKNCYKLAYLPNFGFGDVDKKVRHHFGIEDGDLRRIEAAYLYALHQEQSDGSTLINADHVMRACINFVGIEYSAHDQVVESLTEQEMIIINGDDVCSTRDLRNEMAIFEFFTTDTFSGFAALPNKANRQPWREIFGDDVGTVDEVRAKFRELAKQFHTDVGGDTDSIRGLVTARDEAINEIQQKETA